MRPSPERDGIFPDFDHGRDPADRGDVLLAPFTPTAATRGGHDVPILLPGRMPVGVVNVAPPQVEALMRRPPRPPPG
ncbi:hypothetical protein L6R53_07630 [Myxococcota bacterium]|nr:hypothetical protein [Myxococcota bacterium]